MLCLVNRFVEIYNIAILIQYLFVAIVNFIMEVITATFPAIIIVTDFIIPFCIVGAILLCFIQCIKICYQINIYCIVPIYLELLHNFSLIRVAIGLGYY